MSNKVKRFLNKSKILKFALLSPFLISIPFLTHNRMVKAGIELQWDKGTGYRQLKWFQKSKGKRDRNTIFFFLRPSDRRGELLKISMKIPHTFKSTLKTQKLSLCQVKIGGFESRTKCIKDVPADIELNDVDDKKSLDIFPYSPIPSNKDSYAVVFKVINPKRSGLYQFHTFGQYVSSDPVSSYIGSWTIVID